MIGPTLTADGGEPVRWLPVVVTWAPSSQTLRFVGLRQDSFGEANESWALIAVPVDASTEATILWETSEGIGSLWIHPLNDVQSWAG